MCASGCGGGFCDDGIDAVVGIAADEQRGRTVTWCLDLCLLLRGLAVGKGRKELVQDRTNG